MDQAEGQRRHQQYSPQLEPVRPRKAFLSLSHSHLRNSPLSADLLGEDFSVISWLQDGGTGDEGKVMMLVSTDEERVSVCAAAAPAHPHPVPVAQRQSCLLHFRFIRRNIFLWCVVSFW